MPRYENIEGPKILALFQGLINDKTFLQVTLPESDYDNLTIVTRIIDDGDVFSFQIDSPREIHTAIAETKAVKLLFEYTSDDRVTHRFNSMIQSIHEKSVICESPHYIERHQQRDNFRVKVQYRSQAILHLEETVIKMDIDNVSLGGVYCYCQNKFKPLFEEKANMQDLELSFTLRDECFVIPIQRAQVNRIESKHRPRQFGVAFEFIRIAKEARRQLVQKIYELQREFLQNRLKVMD